MSAMLRCNDCGELYEAKRTDARRCEPCKVVYRKRYLRDYDHGKRRGACIDCGIPIGIRATRCHPCDNKARPDYLYGERIGTWKGGRSRSKGYIVIRIRQGDLGGAAYALEHRLVWEQANGRKLPKNWVVHHLNGIKDDNRIENLLAISRKDHHTHSREHIKPYEERIRQLEQQLRELQPG